MLSKYVHKDYPNGIAASLIFPYLNVHMVLLMAGSNHELMNTCGWAGSLTLMQFVTF